MALMIDPMTTRGGMKMGRIVMMQGTKRNEAMSYRQCQMGRTGFTTRHEGRRRFGGGRGGHRCSFALHLLEHHCSHASRLGALSWFTLRQNYHRSYGR